MPLWLVIGIGGFAGAILRYYISGWVQSGALSFPAGTFAVNFIGSLALGLIMYAAEYKGYFPEEWRAFWTMGVIASFTTMSTFSYESLRLLEQGEIGMFALNVVGTVGLTLLAVYLGKIIVINS